MKICKKKKGATVINCDKGICTLHHIYDSRPKATLHYVKEITTTRFPWKRKKNICNQPIIQDGENLNWGSVLDLLNKQTNKQTNKTKQNNSKHPFILPGLVSSWSAPSPSSRLPCSQNVIHWACQHSIKL